MAMDREWFAKRTQEWQQRNLLGMMMMPGRISGTLMLYQRHRKAHT
jgi:hypothetical protein